MSRSIPRAPALTLALAVALTAACAPTVEPTPTVEPAAPVVAVEPTPEPDETAKPEPAPEPAPTPAGPVYTLEDGTKVEIDPEAETLPKKVRKDLARRATAAAADMSQRRNLVRSIERETGRKAIVILRLEIEPEGKPYGTYWGIGAVPSAIHPPVETKAEAVAIAEAHVAAQDDPGAWVIVVSNQ